MLRRAAGLHLILARQDCVQDLVAEHDAKIRHSQGGFCCRSHGCSLHPSAEPERPLLTLRGHISVPSPGTSAAQDHSLTANRARGMKSLTVAGTESAIRPAQISSYLAGVRERNRRTSDEWRDLSRRARGRCPGDSFICSAFAELICRPSAQTKGPSMSGLLWIILIGFVAGIVARMIPLGPTSLRGSFSPPPSASPGHFFQPGLVRPLAGIGPIKAPASSRRRSARLRSSHLEPPGAHGVIGDPGINR
jgi:hypothetical protein